MLIVLLFLFCGWELSGLIQRVEWKKWLMALHSGLDRLAVKMEILVTSMPIVNSIV